MKNDTRLIAVERVDEGWDPCLSSCADSVRRSILFAPDVCREDLFPTRAQALAYGRRWLKRHPEIVLAPK